MCAHTLASYLSAASYPRCGTCLCRCGKCLRQRQSREVTCQCVQLQLIHQEGAALKRKGPQVEQLSDCALPKGASCFLAAFCWLGANIRKSSWGKEEGIERYVKDT